MYVGAQRVAKHAVDHAVTGYASLAGEAPRDQGHPEVPASSGRAGVSTVQVTLVLDFDVFGLEGSAQRSFDPGRPLSRWDHTAPRSWRNTYWRIPPWR